MDANINNPYMGRYINIGNSGFQRARKSEYVDKYHNLLKI